MSELTEFFPEFLLQLRHLQRGVLSLEFSHPLLLELLIERFDPLLRMPILDLLFVGVIRAMRGV
jgi:hypothetical protein